MNNSNKQLNEGLASVNVEEKIDVSRIRKLAGVSNNNGSTTGTVVGENQPKPGIKLSGKFRDWSKQFDNLPGDADSASLDIKGLDAAALEKIATTLEKKLEQIADSMHSLKMYLHTEFISNKNNRSVIQNLFAKSHVNLDPLWGLRDKLREAQWALDSKRMRDVRSSFTGTNENIGEGKVGGNGADWETAIMAVQAMAGDDGSPHNWNAAFERVAHAYGVKVDELKRAYDKSYRQWLDDQGLDPH